MFEQFYGFRKTPFTKDVPSSELFPSEQHKELLARLQYMVQQRWFGLVSGEIGAGKSTAIRALHALLNPSRHRFLYVSQSGLAPRAFYRELLTQLGIRPALHKADAKRQLDAAIWDYHKKHDIQPVLVIDEAHLLSADMLEEIRFVVNYQMDSAAPLTLVLCGQPELRQRLRLQCFEAISQRINVRFHLAGLSDLETKAYIQHQIRVAGVQHSLFSDEAVRHIHQAAKGIPRRINNIATSCLLDGFVESKSIIDEATVKRVLVEFQEDTA